MPLIETKGAASAQGFGLTLGGAQPVYIEDVFSTYLYTGNDANRSINNGIDLSTKGGLEWLKVRTGGTYTHYLFDTSRGPLNYLSTTSNAGQFSLSGSLTAFNTNGFSLGGTQQGINGSFLEYVSWTFRKQPKFFDVVTYTGTGSTQVINHNLGSVPGCIIVKRLEPAVGSDWCVYHRANTASPATQILFLNDVSGTSTSSTYWGNTLPTSTGFTVNDNIRVNASGGTYVAYLFAHNAGGFGLTGTDNVISCGSFTTSISGSATVSLGYEPQWILMKRTNGATTNQNWYLVDTMRGIPNGSGNYNYLAVNLTGTEVGGNSGYINLEPTGFSVSDTVVSGSSGQTVIYIAIRRGPMKVPTSGTSVFSPILSNASSGTTLTTGFPIDLQFIKQPSLADNWYWFDRLRGANSPGLNNGSPRLSSNSTSAEQTDFNSTAAWANTSFNMAAGWAGTNTDFCNFRRAPGFFDVVCYTGDGVTTGRAINHNLGVAPELIIIKCRNSAYDWAVRSSYISSPNSNVLNLNNNTAASIKGNYFQGTPTSTTFTVGYDTAVNDTGLTYVAYLFATCAGVSKVGSYTGTGALQTVNCGFTGGARFVLIKRTDSTGGWYVYDSARGISSGNDPYLLLNSTAAEVTGTNYVDTTSVGFQVTAAAPAELNANGGTYIFLAIA